MTNKIEPAEQAPVSDEKAKALASGLVPPPKRADRLNRRLRLAKVDRWLERGSVFALDDEPLVVTRVGDDGSGNDGSTIHVARIGADGFARSPKKEWFSSYELDDAFHTGRAFFIDGARARSHVDLPKEWTDRLAAQQAEVKAAREAKIDAGRDPLDDDQPLSHPSYGTVRLMRSSGGSGALFGSPFRHPNQISVEIHRATLHRSLSNDRTYSGGVPLLSFKMSEAQFAQFITSVAQGEGTPITLDEVWGQRMPEPPPMHEVEKFQADAQRTLKRAGLRVSEAIAKVRAAMDKPNLGKKDRDALLGLLHDVERAYNDSLPFTVEQFNERMEKIVAAGKMEIDGYLRHRTGQAPLALTDSEALKLPPKPAGKE